MPPEFARPLHLPFAIIDKGEKSLRGDIVALVFQALLEALPRLREIIPLEVGIAELVIETPRIFGPFFEKPGIVVDRFPIKTRLEAGFRQLVIGFRLRNVFPAAVSSAAMASFQRCNSR